MFLYLIINSNNKILGYGITGNPKERIRKYNEANAANQEFIKMYFGKPGAIRSLESFIKNEWREFRLNLGGGGDLEWIDPKFNKSLHDIVELVEDRIYKHSLPVGKIKEQFLPFRRIHRGETVLTAENVNNNPEQYLSDILK